MAIERTLTTLITAEADARGIVEEAEKEARKLRERAEREAQEIIEEARKQEEQESQRILKEARDQMESARKEILDRAERKAQHWEELYQQNRDGTLKFIVDCMSLAWEEKSGGD